MTWHHITEQPNARQLILVVMNDKIIPDIFVYYKSEILSNGLSFRWGEVQAWMSFNSLPKPEWLAEQILKRETEGIESAKIAQTYRQGRENLFGEVTDPDDE